MSDFLPADYEAPTGQSNYMKLHQGENRFRVLSRPIMGLLAWKDKTPHRFHTTGEVSGDFEGTPKHFWAFAVWNVKDESVQVLEITQSSIQNAITNLSRDPDWGSPFEYDIKIIRKGEGLETEYSIQPAPKSPVTAVAKQALIKKPVNLEALYTGDDPFETDGAKDDLPY